MFEFPSPHPGIINFFLKMENITMNNEVSVPSSGDYQFLQLQLMQLLRWLRVSVPSSGDYQFLLANSIDWGTLSLFPSPHPGIINFFTYGLSH